MSGQLIQKKQELDKVVKLSKVLYQKGKEENIKKTGLSESIKTLVENDDVR